MLRSTRSAAQSGSVEREGVHGIKVGASWLVPVICIAAGVFGGILLEGVIRRLLKRAHTPIAMGNPPLLTQSLREMPFLWSALAGGHAAVGTAELTPKLDLELFSRFSIFSGLPQLVFRRREGGSRIRTPAGPASIIAF